MFVPSAGAKSFLPSWTTAGRKMDLDGAKRKKICPV
jgi:hypothetical protein